ncbi:MAG TPA: potassium-transporting ATPase subunit KdpC [Methanocella sp.]|nr:potassium-transporting ATPase subunit KdpC [Methanocella sp.]
MSNIIRQQIRPLFIIFAALFVLTGVVYPLVVFIVGQVAFPYQTGGSLLKDRNGTLTGSELIGQQFTEDKYFWSRPSYTTGYPYNPLASSGSNYGSTNKKLIGDITNRTNMIRQSNNVDSVPSDLVMGSASGLDPDISLDSALLQVPRVAKARGMDDAALTQMVYDHENKPVMGVLGEDTVNVLVLNLALDQRVSTGNNDAGVYQARSR